MSELTITERLRRLLKPMERAESFMDEQAAVSVESCLAWKLDRSEPDAVLAAVEQMETQVEQLLGAIEAVLSLQRTLSAGSFYLPDSPATRQELSELESAAQKVRAERERAA